MDKMDMMGRLMAYGGTAPINGSQKKSPARHKLGALVIFCIVIRITSSSQR